MKKLIFSVSRKKIKVTDVMIKKVSDQKKCYFCGIDIQKFSHIHEREYECHKSCSMCYYVENLDKMKSLNKGSIILLPELSQIEVFSLVRMISFLSSLENKEGYDSFEEIFDANTNIKYLLDERKEFSSNYYANSIENVDTLGNFLNIIDDDRYSKREIGLKHLRWLPDMKFFKEEMEYWSLSEYSKYTPKNFKAIIKKVVSLKKGKS